MAQIKGLGARQRVVANHAARVQPWAGRIHRVVYVEPRPGGFTKATVLAWRVALEARGLGPISINVRLTAVRKPAVEAADNGLLAPELKVWHQRACAWGIGCLCRRSHF
jgi:hypothetical protein